MGLFDRFRGRAREPVEKKKDESLHDYNGMRVEVFTQEKQLLFIARFLVSKGGLVQLQQATEPIEAQDPEAEPIPVLVRGFEETERVAVHMDGMLSPLSYSIWKLENCRVRGKDNDRSFYRQELSAQGVVKRLGGGGDELSCFLVNISAGGVCLRCKQAFEPEDKLALKSDIIPSSQTSPLLCKIRRVTKRRGGLYEYGCQFIEMSSAMEDQLTRTIFALQTRRGAR